MILLSNLNLSKNELQNAVIQKLATAPISPRVGQIYFDTAADTLMQCIDNNGNPEWVPIRSLPADLYEYIDEQIDEKVESIDGETLAKERTISDIKYAAAGYETATGASFTLLKDAALVPLAALQITGKSTQAATPAPSDPAWIVGGVGAKISMGWDGTQHSLPIELHGIYNGQTAVKTDKYILDGKARTVKLRRETEVISLLNGVNGTWIALPQFDHTGGEAKCYALNMSAGYGAAATPFMLCTHIPYHSNPTQTSVSANGCRANESSNLLYFKVRTDTVINGVTVDSLEKWTAAIAYLEGTVDPMLALVPRTSATDIDITDTPFGQTLLGMVPDAADTVIELSAAGTLPSVTVTYAKDTAILLGNKANKFDWHKDYPQISPTAQNGWVVDTSSGMGQSSPCFAFKDDMGRAHLYISAKSGTLGQKICTLPTGWRPMVREHFTAVSNDGFGYGYIAENGDVVPVSGNNASFWAIFSYYPDITL